MEIVLSCLGGAVATSWMMAQARGHMDVPSEPLGDFYWSMRPRTNACTSLGVPGPRFTNKAKRGTGVFPLLVGCGVKPHDFDLRI